MRLCIDEWSNLFDRARDDDFRNLFLKTEFSALARFSKRMVCGVSVVYVNFEKCVKGLNIEIVRLALLKTPTRIKKTMGVYYDAHSAISMF